MTNHGLKSRHCFLRERVKRRDKGVGNLECAVLTQRFRQRQKTYADISLGFWQAKRLDSVLRQRFEREQGSDSKWGAEKYGSE